MHRLAPFPPPFPPSLPDKGRGGEDELVWFGLGGCAPGLRLGGNLDALGLTVGLTAVDLLARLGNGLEDRLVGQRRLGDHDGLLLLEGDLVGLDACRWGVVCQLSVSLGFAVLPRRERRRAT